MYKNSVLFIVLSVLAVVSWYFFLTPRQQEQTHSTGFISDIDNKVETAGAKPVNFIVDNKCTEEHINIETEHYRAVLTNRGAGVLSWSIKEKNGQWIELVLPESAPVMANFPNVVYKVISKSGKKVVFEHVSKNGWKITKTYNLSDFYMHNLSISIEKRGSAVYPKVAYEWGPGLGTDSKEAKENVLLTRVLAYTTVVPGKLKKLKNESKYASLCTWAAIDNKYFLMAFVPEKPADFDKIISFRPDKKHPYSVSLTALVPQDVCKKDYSVNFYLGPKSYAYLKTYNLGLEKSVDFGFFGFLGKVAFAVLAFLYKLTRNYGWAIIVLTGIIQILVLPLTLKGFKSAAAMKNIQPMIKDIQVKYKDDPKRLQAEMVNVYKSQKVNPLGGCLPMLLQLPIFWAIFTMLRNTYELRNEGWILWIKDLSTADHFMCIGSFNLNLLPLIMGVGMFFQQKMTAATSDPTQKKIMYIMPVFFTFMFWSFPSGLVLYWLANSIITIAEQYFVMKKDTTRHA
jgi:YidC/Oxa1 family membrane protein insertase